MEKWLLQLLETKTGGFRGARFRRCRHCQAWTLHGPDADTAGIMATVDPTPLTPDQEFHAAMRCRRTYTIRKNGKGWHIHDRDPYAVARTETILTVVPAHQCGHRYPPAKPLR